MKIIGWKTFYGRSARSGSPYLTRIYYTPMTRWGQGQINIFHRGDTDPDPHDHPADFWTFPFRSYIEHVYDNETGQRTTNVVRAWCWTKRRAEYTHRVLGRLSAWPKYQGRQPISEKQGFVTLTWVKLNRREWGFWAQGDSPKIMFISDFKAINAKMGPKGSRIRRVWIPWRTYIYGEQQTKIYGDNSAATKRI